MGGGKQVGPQKSQINICSPMKTCRSGRTPSKNTSPSSRSRKGGNNETRPPHFIVVKGPAAGAIRPSLVFSPASSVHPAARVVDGNICIPLHQLDWLATTHWC